MSSSPPTPAPVFTDVPIPPLSQTLFLTYQHFGMIPESDRLLVHRPLGGTVRLLRIGSEVYRYRLYRDARHFPELLEHFNLPFAADGAYAYSPRETGHARGGVHVLVMQGFTQGRLTRHPGQTLCNKKFWGLEPGRSGREITCVSCLERAHRLSGQLTGLALDLLRRIDQGILEHRDLTQSHGTSTYRKSQDAPFFRAGRNGTPPVGWPCFSYT